MASFSFEEAQDTGSFTFEEAAADSGAFSFEEGVDAGHTFGGTVKDVGVSAYKGMLGLQDSLVGLADIVVPGNLGGVVSSGLESLTGLTPEDATKQMSAKYSPAQHEANRKVEEAEGFLGKAGAMVQNPSTIGHSLIESTPSMAAGGVMGRGLMVAGKVPGLLASAAGEGLVGAGGAHEQIRQESPTGDVTPLQTGAAILSGMGTGAVNLASGGLSQKVGFGDIDTMLTTGMRDVVGKGGAKAVAGRVAGGAVTEGLEETLQSGQEQAWQNAALGKPLSEGVGSAMGQGMVVGVAMGAGANVAARPSHLPSEKILGAESVDQVIAEFEADSIAAEPEIVAQPTGALAKAPELYRGMYEEAGRRYGIDPNLLAAQGFAESGFNPEAVSPVGAQGIAQFMPATAQEYGIDPMNPVEAIDGQARYMAKMLERYDGDVSKALAAYNAGPGRVDDGRWLNINETQNYIGKILGELGQESGPMAAEWAAQQQAAQEYNQARNKPQLDESIQFAGPVMDEFVETQQPMAAPPIEEDVPLGPVSGEQIAKNEPQTDLPLSGEPQQRFVPDVPLEQIQTVDNGDGSFSLVHKETGESILDGQSYGSRKEARAAFVQERAAIARNDDGSLSIGEIGQEKAAVMRRQAGPIRLNQGSHDNETGRGSGIADIEARHGSEIRQAGYNSAEHFVADVVRNHNEIRRGGAGSLLLIKKNGADKVAVVRLSPDANGDFYNVETAYLSRPTHKQEVLWSAAQSHSAAPGGQPAFARTSVAMSGQTTPNALPISDVNTVLVKKGHVNVEAEIGSKLGSGRVKRLVSTGKIEILETQQDAEAAVRDLDATPKRSEDGKIQGFTTPDGKVYLVRDGITRGNAMGVLAHEMGVHAKRLGFKKDAEWQGIADSIELRRNSNGRTGQAIRAAQERIPQDTAPEHTQEELVAYLVEHHANDNIPLVDRIVAHIKKWLYKAGIMHADRLSPKDLAVFARAAIRDEAAKAVEAAPATQDVKYSRVSPQELEQQQENYEQDLQDIYEQAPKKFDIRAATPLIKTAEYTLSKIAAGRRALEAVSRRQERKFMLKAQLLDGATDGMNAAERQVAKDTGFTKTFQQLKKQAPRSYVKVQQYLLGVDRTGRGFYLSHKSGYVVTTPEGELVGLAKTKEAALTKARDHVRDNGLKGKVLIKDYGTDKGFIWTAHNPNKSKIGTFANEQEAVAAMIKGERAGLLKRGFSELEANAIQSFREMTNRAFDEHAAGAREVIRRCEEEGIDPPMVEGIDETRRWAVRGKSGKNIATFESREKAEDMIRQLLVTHPRYANADIVRQTDNEIKKMYSLHDAIAQMGDMRGTYFPRQREHGGMGLRAINEQTGEKIFLKGDLYLANLDPEEKKGFIAQKSDALRKLFNSGTPLGRRARKLRREGFVISFERDTTMPEDVFSAKQLSTNIAALMDEAMQRVDKSSMTPAEVAAYVSMHRAVTDQLAGIIKQRGFLSSRMKRSENYWQGFEEDPLKAGTAYANGLASGVAKRQLAQDLTMIIAGRDITWKQWKEDNPSGDWPEYTEFVNERKIDPVAQKNIYGETMSWAQEVLRNQEAADRIIGTLKGLAVLKYLAFRIHSALVNLSNMALGVPATISSHTGLSIARSSAQINRSLKTLVDYKRGTASALDAHILTEISERGWDSPQFNHDAAAVLRSRFGNAWQGVVDAGMWLFGQAEVVNRRATLHAAYKMWHRADPNLTHEELMQKAHHASDRAHGWYGQETAPKWTRGAANPLKAVWTFQKFGQNYLLNIGEMIGKGDYKQAAYMLLAPVVLGGPKATLVTPLLVALAKGLGIGGDDPEEELYKWARDTFGTDAWMRFGAPGLLGISFQGSLAMGIPVVSDVLEKGKRLNSLAELFGAPGSVVYDVYAAGENLAKGEYARAAEKALPSAFGSMVKAARESTEGVTTENYGSVYYGSDPLKVSGMETYLRALSFAPAGITAKRQQQWSERKIKDKYAEKRTDINREIKRIFIQHDNTLPPEAFAKVLPKIDRYNDAVAGLNRPDITPITGKSIRSMLRRNARPSKLERARAMEMFEDEWGDE